MRFLCETQTLNPWTNECEVQGSRVLVCDYYNLPQVLDYPQNLIYSVKVWLLSKTPWSWIQKWKLGE